MQRTHITKPSDAPRYHQQNVQALLALKFNVVLCEFDDRTTLEVSDRHDTISHFDPMHNTSDALRLLFMAQRKRLPVTLTFGNVCTFAEAGNNWDVQMPTNDGQEVAFRHAVVEAIKRCYKGEV